MLWLRRPGLGSDFQGEAIDVRLVSFASLGVYPETSFWWRE